MCQVCRMLGFAFQSDTRRPDLKGKGVLWSLDNTFLGLGSDFKGFSRGRMAKLSASAEMREVFAPRGGNLSSPSHQWLFSELVWLVEIDTQATICFLLVIGTIR
eukprot:6204953-Pleurochrysis_carterae.AAC.3